MVQYSRQKKSVILAESRPFSFDRLPEGNRLLSRRECPGLGLGETRGRPGHEKPDDPSRTLGACLTTAHVFKGRSQEGVLSFFGSFLFSLCHRRCMRFLDPSLSCPESFPRELYPFGERALWPAASEGGLMRGVVGLCQPRCKSSSRPELLPACPSAFVGSRCRPRPVPGTRLW